MIELSLPPVGAFIHRPLNTSAAGNLTDSVSTAPSVHPGDQMGSPSPEGQAGPLPLSQAGSVPSHMWGAAPLPWGRPHVNFFAVGSTPAAAILHLSWPWSLTFAPPQPKEVPSALAWRSGFPLQSLSY